MRTFWIALFAITCALIGVHALSSDDSVAGPAQRSSIDTTALTLHAKHLPVIEADAF